MAKVSRVTAGLKEAGWQSAGLTHRKRVRDRRVLKLIRRFLEAGMMADGLTQQRTEVTPQGGPLSPLLSNILLTDLDHHLEARGLAFCRYADDCNIYVGSRRAGERVMASTRAYLEKALRLVVNEAKSKVAKPGIRKFLGYRIATGQEEAHIRIAPQSIDRLMQRVRELMRHPTRFLSRRFPRVVGGSCGSLRTSPAAGIGRSQSHSTLSQPFLAPASPPETGPKSAKAIIQRHTDQSVTRGRINRLDCSIGWQRKQWQRKHLVRTIFGRRQ